MWPKIKDGREIASFLIQWINSPVLVHLNVVALRSENSQIWAVKSSDSTFVLV